MYVCMYVYILYCSISAKRPLCTYHGHINWLRPLIPLFASVSFNSVLCRLVPSGGISFISVQPSDVSSHLVVGCGNRRGGVTVLSTEVITVYIRLLLFLLFNHTFVKQ